MHRRGSPSADGCEAALWSLDLAGMAAAISKTRFAPHDSRRRAGKTGTVTSFCGIAHHPEQRVAEVRNGH
ncbi:MAG: hypothetical protein A3H32_04535 [Betaproteobacteria bacterium RIFCSPLOWO2_02_FULL_63_19]|nr:MAG: hypothetical protein A3H32_04535 [Betaproteobacteria bacterium RIFCSPLOWO2_02_FULL_63_19]